MRGNIKSRNFCKSMKYFHSSPRILSKTQQQTPLRSSIDQKIGLLRTPVYQRKKVAKRSFQQFANHAEKAKNSQNKGNKVEDQKINENQGNTRGHYRYRSSHGNKNFLSWFRHASGHLQDTGKKKSIIDLVVMEKQIQKDSNPTCQRSNSVMNFKDKSSKCLPNQDSQSLLRKNSLYLLNFIKRKQNQSKQSQPHIGGIPNLASNMRIGTSPTKSTKYTPSKNERVKKQQKIVSLLSKFIHNMPIDPW